MTHRSRFTRDVSLFIAAAALGIWIWAPQAVRAAEQEPLKLAASMYVGWMPWYLAAEDGTLDKYASQAGLTVQFVADEYLETIHRFTEGKVHAVAITNIDALGFVVGAGVASNVIMISSYSHGNDAILLRPEAEGDVTAGPIGLVEFSVSDYLLDRYLEREGVAHDSVERRGISEMQVMGYFQTEQSDLIGVVTWNPMVTRIESRFNVQNVFDSRLIEGEIADMLVVRRDALESHPELADVLLSTWFDVMGRMRGPGRDDAYAALAELSGTTPQDYERQLTTTLLMRTPEVALGYVWDKGLPGIMTRVENWVSSHLFVPRPPARPWVSYADDKPALLHFDDRPLQAYSAR